MKPLTRKMIVTLIITGVVSPCFSDDENQRKRVITPIAWAMPNQEATVYGLRAGPFLTGSLHYLDPEEHLRTDVYGLSLGLLDMADDSVTGIQLATLSGIANKIRGIQCSGFLNFVFEDTAGIQGASLGNLAGNTSGAQIAGLVNRADDMNGVQIAGGNVAMNIKGVQLGLVNLVKENTHGVQLGIYNSAGSLKGVQIGVINFNASRYLPGLMIGW